MDDPERDPMDLEEGAGGRSQHPWGAPSSALHGLLRKLGAGLDDLLPSVSIGG